MRRQPRLEEHSSVQPDCSRSWQGQLNIRAPTSRTFAQASVSDAYSRVPMILARTPIQSRRSLSDPHLIRSDRPKLEHYCKITLRFSSNSALSISPLANRSFKISMAREDVSYTSGSSSRLALRKPQQHMVKSSIRLGKIRALRLDALSHRSPDHAISSFSVRPKGDGLSSYSRPYNVRRRRRRAVGPLPRQWSWAAWGA